MIKIDDTVFDVDYTEFKRNIRIEDKYRMVTADGTTNREPLGTYYEYSLTLGNVPPEIYDALIDKLTEPVPYHTIELMDAHAGTRSFEAIYDDISDELIVDTPTGRIWDNIAIKFTMRRPIEVVV